MRRPAARNAAALPAVLAYIDDTITREQIFHYVYAVLHHPDYRERYANPYVAAELGYVDAIVRPRETRAGPIVWPARRHSSCAATGPSSGGANPSPKSTTRAIAFGASKWTR